MDPQGEDMTTDSNPKPIKSKKSETLEVRIPYETKQAFLTACREDGTTASEVVRDKVQDYLDARDRPPDGRGPQGSAGRAGRGWTHRG